MVRILTTILYGKPIGYLLLRDDGFCDFQYTADFCHSGIQPSPLLMPTVEGRVYSFTNISEKTFHGLPGMIADSLPDTFGQRLLDQWLEANGRTGLEANAIEKLSYMGKRCMGALEYEPSRPMYEEESSIIEMGTLIETARKALSNKEEFITMLQNKEKAILDILRIGTSAGGQRAKAVIAVNEKTGEIRSGQVDVPEGFNHWLLKFDGFDSNGNAVEPSSHGRLEYTYHLCAIEAGINMTECRIMEENGRAHFMTRRFDRNGNKKTHAQTLCALAHYDNRLKGAYSYEQAMSVVMRLTMDYNENEEMFRRMVFNILSVNMDDHTKNISFLMDRSGNWRLSPAYDISFSHNPTGLWTSSHQMTVNGKNDGITRADIINVAKKQGIRDAENIIDKVEYALSLFPAKAREAGVPEDIIKTLMKITKEKTKETKKASPHMTTTGISEKLDLPGIKSLEIKDTINLKTNGKISGKMYHLIADGHKETLVTDIETGDKCVCPGHARVGLFHMKTWKTLDGKPAAYTATRVISLENKKRFGIN